MNFDPKTLMQEATAATGGLTDFGDSSFKAGLDALCADLPKAKLSESGAGILRQKIVGQLVNRLRVEDYFRKNPEIAQEKIAPPVVIVGLPRTGTTKLHRLLACDPRFYWMAWWESIYPVPFPNEALEKPEARVTQARSDVAMMTQYMPKLMAIHPMDADAADEEVMLMEHSFISAFNAYADVPGYVKWLDAQDQAPAYRYLERMLKFLQWQKRKRGVVAQRWVLKAPHHLLRMDVLLRVFPGVKVIQTHRDPTQSIPSIASFIDTLWRIYSDQADAHHAGREWSDLMRRALQHTMNVRQTAPAEQFIDVRFADTVKQPMEVVKRLYAWLGLPLTAEVEQAMQHWLKDDEKSHQGGHEYTAAQFGLSDEQIKKDFAPYRAKHIEAA